MRRKIFLLLVMALFVWLGAFIWFVHTLPITPPPRTAKTDVIIVLTGGPARVEQGLKALAEGRAPILFISGVGRKVTLQEIIAKHSTREVQEQISRRHPQIVLDYLASSTQSNASEAASFVAKHNIRSVRLVTAHYHMPRSLIQFRAAMPGVGLVPDPVVPANFHRNDWWRDESTRKLIIAEFHKYLAARVLQLIP